MHSKAQQENKDEFKFGGAVRYNIQSTNFESDPTALSTSATWDTWRLNIDGSMKGLDLSFEYRFYPTFGTHFIHHGWFGYAFNDKIYMKLGVSQVPFGILKFASHSFFFQGPYYVGLEDDYDMGIRFDIKPLDKLDLAIAYYRQAEPEGPINGGSATFGNAGPGRYSYDISPTENTPVRELNHINTRLAYHINENIEFGISSQIGQNYNSYLNSSQLSTAFAVHALINIGKLSVKSEYINYNYRAKDTSNNKVNLVPVGAYGLIYNISSKANIYSLSLAYDIDVNLGPITKIQPYIDLSLIEKLHYDFENTYHVIPGFLIQAGPIYAFVDFAMGKNHPWLTDDFGVGMDQGRTYSTQTDSHFDYYTSEIKKDNTPVSIKKLDWNYRFNINLGYYF
ncbi:MAG: hypothetical protein C0599_18315 [Salinivirgaceae bacterium]|nr:MAG: hypothetical protein C0599_18315 [Salinivirgaceae bacterium]